MVEPFIAHPSQVLRSCSHAYPVSDNHDKHDPAKDVDGFHPMNVGKMLIGVPGLLPATPHGIQELLLRTGNDPGGKHVVVVGRSNLVGKPVAAILVQKAKGANATVTICHSRTADLAKHTMQADILIAAMGKPRFITADMVKEGAVVIDVGVTREEDPLAKKGYRLVGDVDFEAVSRKAKANQHRRSTAIRPSVPTKQAPPSEPTFSPGYPVEWITTPLAKR